jgi:hypothetical protein
MSARGARDATLPGAGVSAKSASASNSTVPVTRPRGEQGDPNGGAKPGAGMAR